MGRDPCRGAGGRFEKRIPGLLREILHRHGWNTDVVDCSLLMVDCDYCQQSTMNHLIYVHPCPIGG
jgi:hypothetical protein